MQDRFSGWIHFVCVFLLGAVLTGCGGGSSGTSVNGPAGSSSTPGTSTNNPPTISGNAPASAAPGAPYSFQPTATDADKDKLTFNVTSKPAWASFDSATGRLFGTPTASDVGSHEEIVVQVSDGKATAALPQFAINVATAGNAAPGKVSLAWQAPTQNTDGSPVGTLSGFQIHYGKKSGAYTETVKIDSVGITRHVIEDLDPGVYYFVVTAMTTAGSESAFSGEATKTIG